MNEEASTVNTSAIVDAQPKLVEPQLSAIEARVLGALMEKQLTTPDAYPLTLNSLVLACNQKSSREPVSNYTGAELHHCVRGLADRKLVDVDYGSRAERFAQRLTRVLGVDKSAQALLNVLLLRGPQTIHELLVRTQRMHDFETDQNVDSTVAHLCEKFTPIVQRVPRQIGQREDRFVHLLSGMPDLKAVAAMRSESNSNSSTDSGLEERVRLLEKHVAELLEQLRQLQGQSAGE
jgi:uncharacterized protein YceH (UPF0502 family)